MNQSSNENNFRACIMGASLDVGNMGVRALGVSLAGLICQNHPRAEINFMYANRSAGERTLRLSDCSIKAKVINCRLSPRAKLSEHIFWIIFLAIVYRLLPFQILRRQILLANPWLDALAQADFIGEVRGGDSFSDIYGMSRFLFGSLPCLSAIMMGKKPVLLPQTYGPFHSGVAKWLARFIMQNSTGIYSRDYTSIKTILNLTANTKSVAPEFCPEIAFTLTPNLPSHVDMNDCKHWKEDSLVVGINVSGLLYMGGYTRNNMFGLGGDYKEFIHALISEFLHIPKVKLLIIPHVFDDTEENDIAACREVWNSIPQEHAERVRWIDTYCNQSEIKAVIGICDFFIGSRMHACIAAMSQCIPTVGLAYSPKFRGVFGSLGLQDMVIDATKEGKDLLISGCLSRFSERNAVRKKLAERIPPAQDQIRSIFQRMLSERRNMQFAHAEAKTALHAG